jgi:hypothetical protein
LFVPSVLVRGGGTRIEPKLQDKSDQVAKLTQDLNLARRHVSDVEMELDDLRDALEVANPRSVGVTLLATDISACEDDDEEC